MIEVNTLFSGRFPRDGGWIREGVGMKLDIWPQKMPVGATGRKWENSFFER